MLKGCNKRHATIGRELFGYKYLHRHFSLRKLETKYGVHSFVLIAHERLRIDNLGLVGMVFITMSIIRFVLMQVDMQNYHEYCAGNIVHNSMFLFALNPNYNPFK
jgi:hypothetical protein